MNRTALLFGCLALLTACPDPEADVPSADAGAPPEVPRCEPGTRAALPIDGTCVPVGWQSCPEGFARSAAGWGCEPVLPEGECLPGSFPVLGRNECQPVGAGACPEGFASHSSGWGCEPVLPAEPCAGASLEVLGQTECRPLGDCDAAFPPAGALVVDDSFTDAQLDATHFKTLEAALAAAPEGAVVALEEGTYSGPQELTRPVTLRGRCAAKVTLAGDGTDQGIAVRGVKAALSGLRVTGFDVGILAATGSEVTIDACLVEANARIGIGANAAKVAIAGSSIRGNAPQTSVRAAGVAASAAAAVTLTGCAVSGNGDSGVSAQDAGTAMSLVRTAVLSTASRTDGKRGYPVYAMSGAAVALDRSAVAGGHVAGLVVVMGAQMTLAESAVVRVEPGKDEKGNEVAAGAGVEASTLRLVRSTIASIPSRGVHSSGASEVVLEGSVIRGVEAPTWAGNTYGVGIGNAGKGRIVNSAVVLNHGYGVIAQDESELLVEDSLVAGTIPVPGRHPSGPGIVGRDDATLELRRSALVGNAVAALFLPGAARVDIEDCIISDTEAHSIDGVEAPVGFGIDATGGSRLDGRRLALVRNAATAVLADEAETRTSFEGLYVADTRPIQRSADATGYAVAVQNGAQTSVKGGSFLRSTLTATLTSLGARLTLSDVEARGTLANRSRAYGALAQDGGQVELRSVAFIDNPQSGALVADPGSSLSVADSLIRSEQAPTLAQLAYGITGFGGGTARIARTVVQGSGGTGLIFSNAAGSVSTCLLESHAVGLNVQDGSRLTEVEQSPDVLGQGEVAITRDTVFSSVESRAGANNLALPGKTE